MKKPIKQSQTHQIPVPKKAKNAPSNKRSVLRQKSFYTIHLFAIVCICIPSVFAFHHLPALDPVFGVLFSARLHQSPCYRHMVVRSRPDCLGCTPHIGTVSRSVPSTPLQTAFHTRACGSFACFVRRFLRSSRHLRMAGDSN